MKRGREIRKVGTGKGEETRREDGNRNERGETMK